MKKRLTKPEARAKALDVLLNGRRTLGGELFSIIEAPQGFAFISDSVEEMPDDQVLTIARGALKHTERTARILRSFLRDNDKRSS